MGAVVAIVVVTFIIGLIILLVQNDDREKKLREAEAAYRSSLADLKLSPMNADLKEETLRKGRAYSNLTRNNQGVTMYDEVALMNDINAACASAGVPQSVREGSGKSIEERLSYMGQLKDKSLITEQEYEQRRAEILKEL